jgi:16S rRNA processing protein RimM
LSSGLKSQDYLIGLGAVSGAHGILGAIKVRATAAAATTDPAVFAALGELVIGGLGYRVLTAQRHKNQVLLLLDGVHTRAQAEALAGQEVKGDRRLFPPLPTGEYYWFQVLGLPVIDVADGRILGYLAEIIPTPAHDVYLVRRGDREILLPVVAEVIVEINLDEGYLKVSPPEGLLEAYAD